MRGSHAVAFVLGALLGADVSAAEPAGDVEQTPDIALLEYLGSLVEVRDGLVGPDDMQRKGAPDAPNVAEQGPDE